MICNICKILTPRKNALICEGCQNELAVDEYGNDLEAIPNKDEHGNIFWEIPDKYGGVKFHRLDGPAVELKSGAKEWRMNGLRHRLDGPAVIFAPGDNRGQWWYRHGRLHRLDGPAVECFDGRKEYWIEGRSYSYEDWKKEIWDLKNG